MSRRLVAGVLAVAAGGLLALSLPPFGFWPLGLAGLAGWYALLVDRGPVARWGISWAFWATALGVGISWFAEFSLPGYVAAVALEASIVALAGAASAPGRLRWLAFAAALVLAEAVRGAVPFGGIPLAGVDLGQAAGPLAPAARLGGRLLVTGAAALLGAGVIELLSARRSTAAGGRLSRGRIVAGAAALVITGTLVAGGLIAPDGRAIDSIDVVAVQGGGRRGFRATEAEAANVFRRHVEATASLVAGAPGRAATAVDLIVWPEDVVDVPAEITTTPEGDLLATIADRLDATLVAGVVEDEGVDRFRNAVAAWGPDGDPVGRYEKVRRVPFGEYFPFRDVVDELADIPPRDAIPGDEPGFIDTPAAPLGFAISYEGFFPDRARAAVRAGGQLLVIPTNAASFKGSIVPAQQLAAARLRSWETGRWVVQAAPTGYTAFLDDRGRVLERSVLSAQQLLRRPAELRTGLTPYARWGDWPTLAGAAAALACSWAPAVARRRRPDRST